MGKSVLIVDDEAEIREALTLALKEAGYEVESAATAEECLMSISMRPPDLISLDIGLPDLDGWQVINRLNELGHDIPVLIISGNVDAGFKPPHFKLAAGANYLAKPFDLTEFLARVDSLCGRPRRRQRGPRKLL